MNNSPTLDIPDDATRAASETDTLLTVDPTSITDGLDREFQDAEELAKNWKSDAVLYAHTVSFPSNLARGESKRVYVFGSPTTLSDWWTVTVNEQTGERIRAQIPKEDYLGAALPPAPVEFWKINSLQALQIADAAGGKTFRTENPGAEITASLTRQGPNDWLWWVVTYRGLNNKTTSVRIQPATGELYDESGQLVPVSESAN